MKSIFLSLIVTILAPGYALFAQNAVLTYKKLQECLPQADFKPAGFEQAKVTGSDDTYMEWNSSKAVMKWVKPEVLDAETGGVISPETELKISIVDYGEKNPIVSGNLTEWKDGDENFHDEGFDRSVKILNKYPGFEKSETLSDYQSASIEFYIDNRFTITLSLDGSNDLTLLYDMLELIKLDQLSAFRKESLKD